MVQGWTSADSKIKFDQDPATVQFKETMYALGGTIGGCPWDEQYVQLKNPDSPTPQPSSVETKVPVWAVGLIIFESVAIFLFIGYIIYNKRRNNRLTTALMN